MTSAEASVSGLGPLEVPKPGRAGSIGPDPVSPARGGDERLRDSVSEGCCALARDSLGVLARPAAGTGLALLWLEVTEAALPMVPAMAALCLDGGRGRGIRELEIISRCTLDGRCDCCCCCGFCLGGSAGCCCLENGLSGPLPARSPRISRTSEESRISD